MPRCILFLITAGCKTLPVHVAATPCVPHDGSVVRKTIAMLQLPACAAEIVEAGQVSKDKV